MFIYLKIKHQDGQDQKETTTTQLLTYLLKENQIKDKTRTHRRKHDGNKIGFLPRLGWTAADQHHSLSAQTQRWWNQTHGNQQSLFAFNGG